MTLEAGIKSFRKRFAAHAQATAKVAMTRVDNDDSPVGFHVPDSWIEPNWKEARDSVALGFRSDAEFGWAAYRSAFFRALDELRERG